MGESSGRLQSLSGASPDDSAIWGQLGFREEMRDIDLLARRLAAF